METKLAMQDRKILHLLSEDGRRSNSELAKLTGLARETVSYRIKQLVDRRIITSFTAICNLEKLGYSTYHLYISLGKCSREKETELIIMLRKMHLVTYIATLVGEYDLLAECSARSVVELNDLLRIINQSFGQCIRRVHVNSVIQEYNYPHNYLVGKQNISEIRFARYRHTESESIDATDQKILGLLSADARMTSAEMARRLKVSIDKVIYRIKQLEKKDIIQGYRAIIDTASIGIHRYIIMYRLQATEQQERTLIEDLKGHNSLLYLMRCIGEWSLIIDMGFSKVPELRQLIQEIRNRHFGIIQEYTVLTHFEEHKNQYLPA
ncbi:Lrp/AsnC family transcriptional regulator [Candidatus Woesearchaeota archaeon]|nr:Lrp/AsnC family transcriptional regulator [Candidatus Woesearchaeota archaeon]